MPVGSSNSPRVCPIALSNRRRKKPDEMFGEVARADPRKRPQHRGFQGAEVPGGWVGLHHTSALQL